MPIIQFSCERKEVSIDKNTPESLSDGDVYADETKEVNEFDETWDDFDLDEVFDLFCDYELYDICRY
jgi:hypothetical protein